MASITRLLSLGGSLVAFASAAPHTTKAQKRDALPDYALTYAPWTYLFSGEDYFPSDITTHLANVIPEVDYVAIGDAGSATVANLNTYNSSVYLTADSDPTDDPAWISSDYGKPDSSGLSGGVATIIAVEKNSTWTDVFYFYFYSYDYGGTYVETNVESLAIEPG